MCSPGTEHAVLLLPLAASDAMQWGIYAMMAVCIAYVVVRPIMRKKKDPMDKPPDFSLAQQRAVERQMSDLLVELSEMARKVTGQLDTRSKKLELLIHDADEKIAKLERLAGTQPGPRRERDEPRATEPAPREREEMRADARYSAIYTLADQGRSPLEIAQELDRPQGEVELILALRR